MEAVTIMQWVSATVTAIVAVAQRLMEDEYDPKLFAQWRDQHMAEVDRILGQQEKDEKAEWKIVNTPHTKGE